MSQNSIVRSLNNSQFLLSNLPTFTAANYCSFRSLTHIRCFKWNSFNNQHLFKKTRIKSQLPANSFPKSFGSIHKVFIRSPNQNAFNLCTNANFCRIKSINANEYYANKVFLEKSPFLRCNPIIAFVSVNPNISFETHPTFRPFSSQNTSNQRSDDSVNERANNPTQTTNNVAKPNRANIALPVGRWAKLKATIVKEARHYWFGTKLLVYETRIAWGLLKNKVFKGVELTRRERKQLTRTIADLLRVVPFAVIVAIPFAEFALPFLLKIFPKMLPSTYLDSIGEEAKMQKELQAKIEMARFLQETTAQMAEQLSQMKEENEDANNGEQKLTVAEKFKLFMSKVKRGERVSPEEISKFSSLFDNEFTLSNMNKEQLSAMCKLLSIRPIGNEWVLKYKLRKHLKALKEDDNLIAEEGGVDSLTYDELVEACRLRGIHTGQTIEYMKRKLNEWLELSLKRSVPLSLLVLSRTFSTQMTYSPELDLASTLKYMPDIVVKDTELALLDRSIDFEEKLKQIQSEEEEIKLEKGEKMKTQQKIEQAKKQHELLLAKQRELQNQNINITPAAETASTTSTQSSVSPSISGNHGLDEESEFDKARSIEIAASQPKSLKDALEELEELESQNEEIEENIDELEKKQKELKLKQKHTKTIKNIQSIKSSLKQQIEEIENPKSSSDQQIPSYKFNENEINQLKSISSIKDTPEELLDEIQTEKLNQQIKSLRKVDQLNERVGDLLENLQIELEKIVKRNSGKTFENQTVEDKTTRNVELSRAENTAQNNQDRKG